jgi:hypothetical protein
MSASEEAPPRLWHLARQDKTNVFGDDYSKKPRALKALGSVLTD